MSLPITLGPSVVIIAATLVVMLPAFREGMADPYVAGMGGYLTLVFLAVETDIGLFRAIVYIIVPLSFIYAAFIAYTEITGGSSNQQVT